MCNSFNYGNKFCPVSFGVALGLTAFFSMLICGLWMMMTYANAAPAATAGIVVTLMPIPTTLSMVFLYALVAFFKGFLFGFFFALFYDMLMCMRNKKCCGGCCGSKMEGKSCGCGAGSCQCGTSSGASSNMNPKF